MLSWDIYEISSASHPLISVRCRGRLRKYATGQDIDLLTENASDAPGRVRFAILSGTDAGPLEHYLRSLFDDVMIEQVRAGIPNPVLSKLDINLVERYE